MSTNRSRLGDATKDLNPSVLSPKVSQGGPRVSNSIAQTERLQARGLDSTSTQLNLACRKRRACALCVPRFSRWAKKLRALEPCDSCALFQLCREVFEAPRLNLAALYASRFVLARGLPQFSCAFLCIPVQNASMIASIRLPLPAQMVDATLACSLSAGVWKPKVFLGR
jgi:hypothetical protein